MRPAAFLFSTSVFFGSFCLAGPPPADVQEYSEVSLIEVPVYVTGSDGKPVRGLTKEDFLIEDDGTAQPIVAVDDVDLDRAVPGTEEDPAGVDRRRFLFLFDLSYASPQAVRRSRQAALDFVAKGLLPEDLIAVATTSVEAGPHLLLTFTADRSQLLAALRSIGLPTLTDHARDPLAFAFLRPGDPNGPIPLGGTSDIKGGAVDELANLSQIYKTMAQRTADQFAVTRIERQLGGFGALAGALDLVEGRKSIILFSEGFDSTLLSGSNGMTSQEADLGNEAMFHGMYWLTDVDKRFGNSPLARNLDQTLKVFQRSDCVVYAINIAGLQSDEGVSAANIRSRGSDSLYAIAGGTGGELIENSNDLGKQLNRIDQRTRHFYVLSFRPARKRGEGEFHRLKVRVHRRGIHVSARAGYSESRKFGSLSPLERALSSADIIMGGDRKSDFPVTTLGIPFRQGGATGVSLLVRLPPQALEVGMTDAARQLGIYVYATTSSGKLVDYVTRSLRIEGASQKERASSGGVLYSGVLHLGPGDYTIRTLVRDEQSGRFGFGMGRLKVPEFPEGAITLLPPMFLEDSVKGLKIRDGDEKDGTWGLNVGGEDLAPAPDPGIARGARARLCLLIYGLRNGGGLAPFQIDARLTSGDGSSPRPAPVSLVGRAHADADGLVELLIDFSSADLAPGSYRLQVTIRDSRDSSRKNTSEAAFRVL